jgi:hypothetical protein
LDEYVRERQKIGLTLELGEKGPDPGQAERAYVACTRLIEAYDAVSRGASLPQLADRSAAISWYETADIYRPAGPHYRLRQGLGCFSKVAEGEVLSAPNTPDIRASAAGCVMFPKYPKPGEQASELFRLATELKDPFTHYS